MEDKNILLTGIILCFIVIAILYAKMILIYHDVQMKRNKQIANDLYRYHELNGTLGFYLGIKPLK